MPTPLACPYVKGARFVVEITPGKTGIQDEDISPYHATIAVLQAFEPFTISPVLKVKLESSTRPLLSLPSEMVFKVFDRRYANDLREFHEAAQLSQESEEGYRAFITTGSPWLSQAEWEAKRFEEDENDKEHPVEETEAYLSALLASYHNSECEVYERLTSLQGRFIPTFFGQTRFITDASHPESVDTTVPGILLEFIPGTKISDAETSAVTDEICTACIKVVNACGDAGILNRDVRLENFIIPSLATADQGSPGTKKGTYELVVMIDFAQCRLRGGTESDDEWKRAKWSTDEEGAVGYTLGKRFSWKYEPSYKYLIAAEEE